MEQNINNIYLNERAVVWMEGRVESRGIFRARSLTTTNGVLIARSHLSALNRTHVYLKIYEG